MKYFCCDCGRQVPLVLSAGEWAVGHCRYHPTGLRYKETFAKKWFEAVRLAMGVPMAQAASSRLAEVREFLAKQTGGAS